MDADVVGSGPTGLLLAGDLAEAGVSVSVLERRTTEPNVTRGLAAAAHGWGDQQLLDSFDDDRDPVGRQVQRSSGAIIRLAMIRPRWSAT
jgi:choline dehydrogenase-like flavoprotein